MTRRTLRRTAIAAGLVAAVLLLVVAALPFGWLRGIVAERLSARIGRPVSIAAIERVDRFGFTPTVAIRGLRIPQPAWAGTGDMIRIDRAQATVPIWPLLIGSLRPHAVTVSGLRAALVRDAEGRTNWAGSDRRSGQRGRGIEGLTIRDAVLDYRDAKRDRRVVARVSSDPQSGFHAAGTGVIHGNPVRVAFAGAPIVAARRGAWPFTATIDGPALAMTAHGTMARPLDTATMTLDVTARATDLALIDAVIEAGLIRTQPVTLSAHVRHDPARWQITALRGTIGRSAIAGALSVARSGDRNRVDGTIRAARLDFDDLSTDAGIARGQALERRIGPKLVPNMRVDIGKIARTDGRVRFVVNRVLSRQGPPAIRAMSGTLTMDHRLLRVDPLVLQLARGAATGHVVVDQHDGGPEPLVTIDLALRNSDVPSLMGGEGTYTGRAEGRARLSGTGETLRAAVGRSDGRIGFVIRDGALPERLAAALGFDALRTLLASGDARAGLRCVVAGLDVRHGVGRTDPLVVDTTQSRLDGTGTVTFPAETLAIRFTGAPKHGGGLRLPGAVVATGTLKAPAVYVPPQVKSVGNIFKAIGRAIRGRQGPLATDANCAALAARVLR
ncbi:AsmA-like C-terminal region-containing protein [Sphingomonas sp.]|uniref:AsmA family protein n=1 Tax=Sphingomonas sp. TaxID=28214 RepID=UPI0035BB9F7C